MLPSVHRNVNVNTGQASNTVYHFKVIILMFVAFLLVTDITTLIMSAPASFKDAFKGKRTYLVGKILPSTTFWTLMLDHDVLLPEHVSKLKVFCNFLFLYVSAITNYTECINCESLIVMLTYKFPTFNDYLNNLICRCHYTLCMMRITSSGKMAAAAILDFEKWHIIAALWNRAGHYIFILWFLSIYLSIFFFLA